MEPAGHLLLDPTDHAGHLRRCAGRRSHAGILCQLDTSEPVSPLAILDTLQIMLDASAPAPCTSLNSPMDNEGPHTLRNTFLQRPLCSKGGLRVGRERFEKGGRNRGPHATACDPLRRRTSVGNGARGRQPQRSSDQVLATLTEVRGSLIGALSMCITATDFISTDDTTTHP